MKKNKHPEYIDGIKQVQNPLLRILIKVWYSDWFRVVFFMLPLKEIVVCLLLSTLGVSENDVRATTLFLYALFFIIGMVFNDYSNLRKIGLDEYHNKLEED